VVDRLTSSGSQLGSILRLDTSYGGGKTHALIGLQPSPLTLTDLEAILKQPSLLPPGCSARPTSAYDFAWTQPGLDKEMRVTCNASYYAENSDSCELWVPGSPLFPMKFVSELIVKTAPIPARVLFIKMLETNF
jgi:hypothetical protein